MAATTICLMNFKGGVGKTTLTVNLAAGLANETREDGEPYKVLLIDADPQSNASVYTLGEYWRKTIYPSPDNSLYGVFLRLFKGSKNGLGPDDIIGSFDEDAPKTPIFATQKKIFSDGKAKYEEALAYWPNLHVIPSHYGLVNIEKQMKFSKDGTVKIPALGGSYYYFEILDKISRYIRQKYDFILIDCPPNLYTMSENALYFADHIVIPVIPDWLSTNGINWLVMQLFSISKKYRRKAKSIRAIVPTLWTEKEAVFARHIRILKRSLASWKKIEKYQNILEKAEVWEGLQRSSSVTKAIDSLRPIVDYPSTEASRAQLNLMLKQIIQWREGK
ncbi:MAG: AAA family ATPase [Leptospiraceae bacterium]|nr:AAA family ATPase [Leptospiraceae bacterium]MCP5503034.1 AAA family ATPase [Leptospiraceae bacterium]